MLDQYQFTFRSHYYPGNVPDHSANTSYFSKAQEEHIDWERAKKYIASEWWNRVRRNRALADSLVLTKTLPGESDRIVPGHATSAKASKSTFGSDVDRKRFRTGVSDCSPRSHQSLIPEHINPDCISKVFRNCIQDFKYLSNSNSRPRRYFGFMENRNSGTTAKKTTARQSDRDGRNTHCPVEYIAVKRREAVDSVMNTFNMWLHKQLSVISCAYEAADGSDSAPSGSSTRGSSSGTSGGSSGRGRTKRQFNDSDEKDGVSGDGDDDKHGDDRGGNKRAKRDIAKLFACPFFQHDPTMKYCSRACTGPGWPSIHRLKEHLTRVHRLDKFTCPRCCDPMEDQTKLNDHLRSDTPCVKRDVPRSRGINDAQEKKLRERRKTTVTLTDEQKWLDIYVILFPEANQKTLPSPYYTSGDAMTSTKSAAQWKKMRKHIEEELPSAVRKRVEHRFAGAELEVLQDLGDIVRDEIFQIFRCFPGGSAPATPGPSSRSATPKSAESLPEPNEPDFLGLEPFWGNLHTPFDLLAGMPDCDLNEQLRFPLECGSDSGYASGSSFLASGSTQFSFE